MTRLIFAFAVFVLAAPFASATVFLGNANSGFGGVLGTGMLDFTNTSTVLDGKFTRGAGDLNDAAVIYIDSQAGGFTSTASFDDAGDELRQAISGFDGASRSTVNFAPGFDADFAIAFDQGFAGLWQLSGTGMHTFVADGVLSPTDDATATMHTFSFDLSDFGVAPGDSFDFVGTYLNPDGAFRSNEAIGTGLETFAQGANVATFTGSETFNVTAVPEPTAGVLLLCIGGVLGVRRRRS